jgi:aldehyde:ferredoxin oxidoreductase
MFNGGYLGKLMRINLSTQTVSSESINAKDVKKFLGGRGMAAKYYYDEIGPEVSPLSVENKLIFMTGPITGLRLPTSTKFQLATKSPITGHYLCSNSSGDFGPFLKKAGFDALIIEGQAKEWTYLTIKDEAVSFHSADEYMGKNAAETEKTLKKASDEKKTAVMCVGVSGELQNHLASIVVDERFFGRGGGGAVMGSKKLKAVILSGSNEIPVSDMQMMKDFNKGAIKDLKASRVMEKKFGTHQLVEIINGAATMPTRNFQTSYFVDGPKIDAHNMVENYLEKNTACYMCPIACGKLNKVKEGPFAGAKARTEYETIAMLGSNCDINDFGAILKASQRCDEYGIDTISAGAAVGMIMELYGEGLITTDDTGGIEANFGDPQALVALVEMIAEKRAIGELFSQGMNGVIKAHPEWEPYAVHVKGMSLSAYDPRGAHGNALTFGTSSRGACHCVGGYTVTTELFNDKIDRFGLEGKGALVKGAQDTRAFVDSAGICTVARRGLGFTDTPTGNALLAVTGYDFTPELPEIGNRIYNLERIILNREGVRRKDDQIPYRLKNDKVADGPIKGRVITDEMYNTMLSDFYSVRGWDEEGVVIEETIAAVDLADIKTN